HRGNPQIQITDNGYTIFRTLTAWRTVLRAADLPLPCQRILYGDQVIIICAIPIDVPAGGIGEINFFIRPNQGDRFVSYLAKNQRGKFVNTGIDSKPAAA